ncbi:hypothetical protein AS156_26195 [Bradyrhizobium macuxiense]|uniref:DUF4262 domain-containing protein n=1 Tax=Bradyrhizobium macuxiense TaxID=1755647 RepID=A0A109K579_9BRAD|nr:DUF4262 domain-containing protein [Bradyrhizobium macuxiense]KWV60913.1 hypothetical protein AS156_26195 [Bradyrhizobium macuxiense]
MQDQFKWPPAESEVDEKILDDVRTHGCHIVQVLSNGSEPEYAFSVGLYLNFAQAELAIFGLDRRDAANVINEVRARAATGHIYSDGDVCDDLLVDRRLCFARVPGSAYRPYFGTALWFYGITRRPFPILEMVWADLDGRFPWESGYDVRLKKYQPVLRSLS